ncbi:hydantoinase/oxoprolinase family protein [Tuwongella immobilis]|uniref:Hydantoinase A/oxoprolinase domain-containing protein n=1 Tax=Tuwongella immobilis TaxID=692036 RepID=A0A6C2YKW3_9BACT|nr:hydantoinase/oxoprolinase family protein [Tuwongella immobilis]VIP01552.1 h4mpt-linked c1 transfer pathway protein : Conserved protein OS=Gemmata sp. Wa1-1 PE=4 SV=1: Hydantoinase_A [Tuwongella immobilis]VTR98747.1 h4mpt-linked c1 transfer pathway protein : Conserved protein OS=Gemmata sp. Wa1-1 PE=4 SV=1: Hydantoinase_A [Tuwongella immobilis]
MSLVLALDIGGANLKAATVDGFAGQLPFPLWQKPDELAAVLRDWLQQFASTGFDAVAVTMTGELCDCYLSKREGVNSIIDAVEWAVEGRPTGIWLTSGELVSTVEARTRFLEAAASNWHALATYVGRLIPHGFGLLLDIGSTTTDLIPLLNGVPNAVGRTDMDRMLSQELVYTGVRRTPVAALMGARVMAERFATTQDVYQWLGELPDDPDDTDTADGRPATRAFAAIRLARMLGGDGELTQPEQIQQLALDTYSQQRAMIVAALHTIVARYGVAPESVILSGAGEFLAQAAWIDYHAQQPFSPATPTTLLRLSDHWGEARSLVAPAAALAILAQEQWE